MASNLSPTQQSIEQTLRNLPGIGERAYQPSRGIVFPKREYGKTNIVKRSFQSQWFSKWQWLRYDADKDVVYCYTCVIA